MVVPRVSPDVRRLCRQIETVDSPLVLEVLPRSDAAKHACFDNAANHVAEHGGSIQHGWLIWEWTGILLEADFHAVWRRPDSSLLDVSVNNDNATRVLFAPDRTRQFNSKMVPAVMRPLGRNPLIRTYISMRGRFEAAVSDRYQHQLRQEIVLTDDLRLLDRRIHESGIQLLKLRDGGLL